MDLHKLSLRVSSAALLFLAAAVPAAAADPAATPSNQATVAAETSAPAHSAKGEAQEPKRICRTIAQTNSRLRNKKVCLTREQWRDAKYN